MKDEQVMRRLCDAGAAALEAGMKHARQDDPHVYAELIDLLQKGLCEPEMVIRFKPSLSVVFHLVSNTTADETGAPIVLEVFRYGTPQILPANGNTH